jgi:hypothetical protein
MAIARPLAPGPEMDLLRAFYPDTTWTGVVHAGGMGPDSPPMTARGRGTHAAIQSGLWIVGDYEQEQFLTDGTFVLTWRLHWVTGWDPARACYVATLADNYGHADVMLGRVAGNALIYESAPDAPVRLRLTWDRQPDGTLTWRNESSAGGGPWFLVEEYSMSPVNAAGGG